MNTYINVHGTMNLSPRKHAWRDSGGDPHAIVDLGACDIAFGSAEDARAVAAACLAAAEAIDALPLAERAS